MLSNATRQFLEQPQFGVLATISSDGLPQQTVMWYELIDDRIMMNTSVGRLKERNISRDPRVSICIEEQYNYVTLSGRAKLDYDPDRSQADIARLARRYHPPEKAKALIASFQQQRRVTIWLDIEHVISTL